MKTLIFIRHAHRDKIHGEPDNGLSKKGWLQAADTANALQRRAAQWEGQQPKLLTSPKLRCMETADALASVMKIKAVIDDDLDEAAPKESSSDFVGRIKDFLARWKRSPVTVTMVCSHGDWIPEAIRILTGKECDIKKGASIERALKDSGEVEIVHRRDPSVSERTFA